jgi:hypothetical protein
VTATIARGLAALLWFVAESCTQTATSAPPIPSSTTIAAAGSPCAPTLVAPELFENHIPVVPSPTARPAFSGTQFTGVGKVVSVGSDAVVLELVDLTLRAYGATTVRVDSTTSFDGSERAWALVSPAGVAAGATDVPLAPGAPAIDAGRRVVLECHRGPGVVTAEGTSVAKAAGQGSASWTLERGLLYGWPGGTMIWYDRVVHYSSLADLHVVPGRSVYVDFAGTPDKYVAKKLTYAGVSFGYRG